MKQVRNNKDHLGRINVMWKTARKKRLGYPGKAWRTAHRTACHCAFETQGRVWRTELFKVIRIISLLRDCLFSIVFFFSPSKKCCCVFSAYAALAWRHCFNLNLMLAWRAAGMVQPCLKPFLIYSLARPLKVTTIRAIFSEHLLSNKLF